MSFNLLTLTFYWDLIYCIHVLITLRAAQCIVIGPVCGRVCGFVRLFVCLWVCYHDNSKLRASILTKLSLKVKVSSWLNFGRPAHPGRGSAASENFRLRVSIARAHYLRLSKRFFHFRCTRNSQWWWRWCWWYWHYYTTTFSCCFNGLFFYRLLQDLPSSKGRNAVESQSSRSGFVTVTASWIVTYSNYRAKTALH